MLPGRFGPLLQLIHAHPGRAEHHMLTVIELPVFSEDSPGSEETSIKRSVRERSDDSEAWQIDVGLHGKLRGLQKDIRIILVEPKDKTPLQRDAVLMERFDQAKEFPRAIKSF